MNEAFYYRPEGDEICGSFTDEELGADRGAPFVLTITIPRELAWAWYQKARQAAGKRGVSFSVAGDGDEIAGFFDFVKKAVRAVAKIAKLPLVKAVVGVIPYGGTITAAIEAADTAVGKASKKIAAAPAVHKTIARAAQGDPKARADLARLSPALKKKASDAIVLQREALRTAAALREARQAMAAAEPPDGLKRAFAIEPAPWA